MRKAVHANKVLYVYSSVICDELKHGKMLQSDLLEDT